MKVRHNHIVNALTTAPDPRRRSDGGAIILNSGDVVYGNEFSDNLIEDDPTDRIDSLRFGIWAAGSGSPSRSRPPNRFIRNTIVGAETSIVIAKTDVADEFEDNISYRPRVAHVRIEPHHRGSLPRFDDNLYYPVEEPMFQLADGKRVRFAEWQAAVAGEAWSLVADPEFVDAAARDYRLRESSPARGRGMGGDASARDDAGDE